MRHLRWQILIAIGGLILVIGLLAGQAPEPSLGTPQPVEGGVYTEALVGSILRLNPILDDFNQTDQDVNRLLYRGIVRFDSNGLPQADLADRIAISADARLYTVTLRSDAKWHDGTDVSADDVIYTFSKFQDAGYPGSTDLHEFWQAISIVRLDDLNVQFQLPEPYAPFLDYLETGLLPEHLLRGVRASELIDHPFNLEPIGTGPFEFESYLRDLDGTLLGVSLTAYDQFYLQRPFLERIEFRFYELESDALEAYKAGEVQGIGGLTINAVTEALAIPGLNLHSSRYPRSALVFLNTAHTEKAFLGEKEVRKALLLGTDRQKLVDQLLAGQALVATSPVLPGGWAFASEASAVSYDPRLAGEILDEADWLLPVGAAPGTAEFVRSREDGGLLSIRLTYLNSPVAQAVAEMLRADWRSLGFQVEMEPVSGSDALRSKLDDRDFDAILAEIDLSGFPDPDPYAFWHDSQAQNGQNYSSFTDRNISIWLEQARTTPDLERRSAYYRDFQIRFSDQVPAILLYHPIYSFGISAEVQGVSMGPITNPSDRYQNVADWFLLVRRGFDQQSDE
jgi:peptide/nickel transport system substrate-binding protein